MRKIFEINDETLDGIDSYMNDSIIIMNTNPEMEYSFEFKYMWLYNYLEDKCYGYSYVTRSYIQQASENKAMADAIKADAAKWIDRHNDDILKLLEAYFSDYNPLWNVDGTETRTFSDLVTHMSYGESRVTTDKGNDVMSSDTYAFNSSTPAPENRITNSYGDGQTVSHPHIDTNTVDSHTETLVRGGNIGLTSSAQLLTGELGMRLPEGMIDMLCRYILQDHAYYIG